MVKAEAFAQTSFGAGAGDGVADGGAGGDETGAGRRGRCSLRRQRRGFGRGRAAGCVKKHKGAAVEAAPVGANINEIGGATKMLVGPEAHGRRGGVEPQREGAVA